MSLVTERLHSIVMHRAAADYTQPLITYRANGTYRTSTLACESQLPGDDAYRAPQLETAIRNAEELRTREAGQAACAARGRQFQSRQFSAWACCDRQKSIDT